VRFVQATPAAAPRSGLIRTGRFFFKYRDLLFPLVFLPLALGTHPRALLGDPRVDLALGALVVFAGQGLRALVIGLAYIQRGGKNKQIYAKSLVQGGIFAHSRNPLYVGNLLIIAGLVLMHAGPWMLLAALPFFLFVYIAIVAAEECFLSGEFGAEYAEYCARVPRFLPRLEGLPATLRSMGFDWQRLIRKEYGTIFSSVSAVLLMVAWKYVSVRGFESSRELLRTLAIVWIPFVLAYLTARVLKKSGRLGKDQPAPAA
jgi:protein-S-isoprenylcysteine O-methyltransferase Ste14